MTHTYTRPFQIRHYELDSFGHVNNAVYLNYLQQAAMEASSDAGYGLARYDAMGVIWLIRKTIIEYSQPGLYGDELQVKTWVSDIRRVQSRREYHVTHVASGVTIVRAQMNWAFLDKLGLTPTRIPAEMVEVFGPNGVQIVRDLKPGRGEKPAIDPHRYLTHRRVQHYELDPAQHVNNAVYLNWVEQAFYDATTAAGFPPARLLDELDLLILVRRNEFDYFAPATEGDEIEITSWVNTMARTHGTWIHEMRRESDQTLLARAHSTGAFANRKGHPVRLPDEYLLSVLHGGAKERVRK